MSEDTFKVGGLVWAKMSGYRPWPAKVIEAPEDMPNDKLHVYFFGSQDQALVRIKDCHDYAENRSKFTESTPPRSKFWKAACDEIAAEYELRFGTPSAKELRTPATNGSAKVPDEVSGCEDPFLFNDDDDLKSCGKANKLQRTAAKQKAASNFGSSEDRIAKQPRTSKKASDATKAQAQSDSRPAKRAFENGNAKTSSDTKDQSALADYSQSPRLASALRLAAKSRLVDVPNAQASQAASPVNISEYLTRGGRTIGFLLDTDFTEGRALLNAVAALGSRLICQLYTSRPLAQLFSPVSSSADCTFADSEEQVVAACDLLVLAIETPEILDEVLFGVEPAETQGSSLASELLATLNEQKVVVALCGALDSQVVADFARRVQSRGARFIELQLLNSGHGNEPTLALQSKRLSNTLVSSMSPDVLVQQLKTSVAAFAGDETLCRQFATSFSGTVKHCLYLGEQIGNAQKLRCSVLAQHANLAATLAESLGFLERVGVNAQPLVQVLQNSTLNSPFLISNLNAMLNGTHHGAPYPIASAMHDAIAFAQLAERTALCTGASVAAHEQLKLASLRGHSTDDLVALFEPSKQA